MKAIPPASAAWSFNFHLKGHRTLARIIHKLRARLKLKDHAAEADVQKHARKILIGQEGLFTPALTLKSTLISSTCDLVKLGLIKL